MIRPSNINKQTKRSDFKCDRHGGIVEKLDLRTKVQRLKNKGLGILDEFSEDIIIVKGKELSPPCECVSSFPTWDPGNKLGKELGEAKTKND